MPQKKLTAREAWAYLAKAWAGPEDLVTNFGLCSSITTLVLFNVTISERTADSMRAAIKRYAPSAEGKHFPFRWDCGLKSHDRASRAAFCRAMARRLKPKKAKVGK